MSTLRLRSESAGGVLTFDLENRPLAYWYPGETTAEITAIGWKWDDNGPEAFTLLLRRDGRFVDDQGRTTPRRKALEFFRQRLDESGIVTGHNIRGHDLPIFNAALLREGLDPLPELLTSDTLRDYPRRKYMSASLENLAEMYGITRHMDGKKHMSQIAWEQANRLEPSGIELARERVVSDVLLQESLRNKMLEVGVLGAPRVWRP